MLIFTKIRNVKISKVTTTLSATIQPMLQKTDLPERAQAISLELAKQMFPGYQALVVTHTDGHNESGNIHTHIVINSMRKTAVEGKL